MYESYYGYREAPFRLSPDPAFYFGSKGHNRALAYLQYGLKQKEGFIVITGSPGTGKTTIARALLQDIARDKVVVSELNNTHLQADDVLRMAAASFGLEHENLPKSSLLKRLENFFLQKYHAGYHCLLVIDEAQNLPFESLEELRMLSNFYHGKHALLQIFLLGQQQFRDILYSPRMEQLRQRVVAATHLEPLSAIDTRDYIRHRLSYVGWNGDNPEFTKRAFAHIYALTRGIPRRINTFCDRVLLFSSLEEIRKIDDEVVQTVARELKYEVTGRHADSAPSAKTIEPEVASADEEQMTEPVIAAVEAELGDEEQAGGMAEEEASPGRAENAVSEPEPEIEAERKPAQERSKASTNKPATADTKPEKPAFKVVRNNNSLAEQTQPAAISETESTVSDEDTLVELVALALDFCRKPENHTQLTKSNTPLPMGMLDLFKFALGRVDLAPQLLNSRLENTSAEELKQASRFFIKEVLLNSSSDYYRRLGLTREADETLIKLHYRYLFRLFQPDQEENAAQWDESYTRKINQAYTTLREKEKRNAYNKFLDSLKTRVNKPEHSPGKSEPIDSIETAPTRVIAPETALAGKRKSGILMFLLVFLALAVVVAGAVYMVNPRILVEYGIIPAPAEHNRTARDVSDARVDIVTESFAALSEKPVEITEAAAPIVKTESKNPSKENAGGNRDETAKETPEENGESAPAVNTDSSLESKVEKTPTTKNEREAANNTPVDENAMSLALVQPPEAVTEKKTTSLKASPKPKIVSISDDELTQFMQNFALRYEEAKLDDFMSMFNENAQTNDRQGRDGIREDYAALFDSTDMRVIDIQGLDWQVTGKTARGTGNFTVTVLRKGSGSMHKIVGSIELEVMKSGKDLLFTRMVHAYKPDSN